VPSIRYSLFPCDGLDDRVEPDYREGARVVRPIPVAGVMAVPVAVSVTVTVSVGVRMAVSVEAGLGRKRRAADRLQEAAESQPHFGGGRRLACVAAAEDDVLHLVAAQALGALLAHHPRDRVGDVALAAPVGPDDRRDALVERELGPIRKRFEAVDL
jgi:hypothetical protein